jgi:hypothetical protein
MKEILQNNRVIGYKQLSNPELGRTSQTHIGLSNLILNFLNKGNSFTLKTSDVTFFYQKDQKKSTTTINCITRADGTRENPKMISGRQDKESVVKLIKSIASRNNNEYWLVWDSSVANGKFLLVEKGTDDYNLITQLENGEFDETKVQLIRGRFENKSSESKNIKYEHSLMTTFSLTVIKLLIKEFGEEFLIKHIEEDKSKNADVKLKIPKYMGTPMVFGCFSSEKNYKLNSNNKFHPENLKILGRDFIFFTNQFTEVFKSSSNHCSMDRFAKFINDYSEKKYSIIKEDGIYKLVLNTSSPIKKMPEQKIFFGSPGSGKSYHIKSNYPGSWPRITFHPELDYHGFVGAYKPSVVRNPKGDKITYRFVEEAFIKAYCEAWKTFEPYYLIIEEINRGNCAQIFGDIFQLLDRGNDGFSEYPIICSPDVREHLAEELADIARLSEYVEKSGSDDFSRMILPNNLNILCTMNTSDQSLFPMDSAFKRRWDWHYIPIDYYDAQKFKIDLESEGEFKWGDLIYEINQRIKDHTQSEDKQLGNRFVSSVDCRISKDQFVSKVVFYLWSEIYKDEHGTGNSVFMLEDENELTFSDFFDKGKVNLKVTRKFIEKFLPPASIETDKNSITENFEIPGEIDSDEQ